MDYIIGVDGGGTKTEGIAYNLNGDELCRAYSGFGNLCVDKKKALDNIVECIENCMQSLKEENCRGIYLGLAGISSGNNMEIVEEALKEKFNVKIRVFNDADIALTALLKGEDGVLTIAGTGSISIGVFNGKKARAGGWGHLIGDEGSGYYITMEAFKNMANEEDSNIPLSELSKAILKEKNFKEVNDIKSFIYSSKKADIAALAPIVVSMAEKGEENAKDILRKSGIELGIITEKVLNNLQLVENIKVGIKGSILTRVTIVRESFEEYLKSRFNGVVIIDEDVSPAKAAVYLAKKEH